MTVNIKKDFGNSRNRKPNLQTLVYGKVPPQNPDAEKSILASLLIHNDAIPFALEILSNENCFYVDAHSLIFSCIHDMHHAGFNIDIITLKTELQKREQLEIIGGFYFLTELLKSNYNISSLEQYCRSVMEKFIQRELIRVSGNIISESYNDSSDVFDLLGQAEYDINALVTLGDTETMSHIAESVKEVTQDIEDLANGTKKYMGVPTGIYMLDHLTKGWQDTDLIILAARPSQGKTAEALHHVLSAAIKGIGVAVFSLEMGKKQLTKRLISNHSEVELEKINEGTLNASEQQRVNNSAAVIANLPIFIDDRAGNSIQRICSKIKMLKRKDKIGLAVLDYLQLASIHDTKGKNREQQIAEMSRALKVCAKDCELPIIALSQMNRAIDTVKGRKPELSDLRESGAIEQDADIVIFIHHDNGKTWLVVRKHRNGRTDDIEVVFLGAIQKFVDPNEMSSFQQMKPFSEALRNASTNSIYTPNEPPPF